MYICAYYRPPSDTTESLYSVQLALDEISNMTKNNPKSTIIVAGDFNARDIDLDRLVPTPDCKKKGICNKLISTVGDARGYISSRGTTPVKMPYWTCSAATSLH